MATATNRVDLYTRVTSHIIEELERGTRPWLKPWNAEHAAGRITRPLRHNGQKYSGINIITLWMQAEFFGFVSPFWLTFNQARDLGAFIKKGEHGSPVVYASTFTKKDKTEAVDETEQEHRFLKEYTVFNADSGRSGAPQQSAQYGKGQSRLRPNRVVDALSAAEHIGRSHGVVRGS